ncbi:MAG TPA: serine hydrolase domain-containing protein [Pyrinomonadaceae bacterium]|jgi:CubicO group peptidase (beta-lactamase class C family)
MKRRNRNVKIIAALLFAAFYFGVVSADAQTAVRPAQTAAGRRAEALVEILGSYNPAAWRKFIGENFTKPALERVSAEARVNSLARIYDRTRGLAIKEIRFTKTNEITVSATDKLLGENFDLLVLVEENAPYQITGMGFRPQPNDGNSSAKKLTEMQVVAELEAYLKKLAAADVFSGVVLLAKGDKILFEKAYGEANKDFKIPNTTKTKFNLGSMNKMFTSVAVAQLVEAGKISFDDPLGKFLPEFPSKEAAEKIKIKHLLTHTSGLGSYFTEQFLNSSRANYRTVDDYLELVKGEKPAFEPGTRWSYSNTGMLILGKVIEKASGQNYFDYVRENIYRKAGMINTDAYELDRVNSNLAVGYTKEFGEKAVEYRNNIFMHVISGGPAGGGYSTVEDLLKFSIALQNGVLIKPETLKLMRSPKPEISSPDYGYGFMLTPQQGVFGHGGDFMGVSANLDMFSDSGYSAIVLSNYDGTRQIVGAKLQQLIAALTK